MSRYSLKPCRECGQTWARGLHRADRRYCSGACRAKAYRRRRHLDAARMHFGLQAEKMTDAQLDAAYRRYMDVKRGAGRGRRGA